MCSGAVCNSRWPSWAPVLKSPYVLCGREATLNTNYSVSLGEELFFRLNESTCFVLNKYFSTRLNYKRFSSKNTSNKQAALAFSLRTVFLLELSGKSDRVGTHARTHTHHTTPHHTTPHHTTPHHTTPHHTHTHLSLIHI